jgi:Family of unknown function (DUF5677)
MTEASVEDRLAKFYPMEFMPDHEFVLFGVSIISRTLQQLLDAWLPMVGGTSNYHSIDDPHWNFVSNTRVCEALRLLDEALIDDLALLGQMAGLYASKPRSRLASRRPTAIVNKLGVLETLESVAANGDPSATYIAVLRMNLGSTRDRFRMAVRILDANLISIAADAERTPFARFNPKSQIVTAGLSEGDLRYRSALADYQSALDAAIEFSRRAANRPSETSRVFWASVLFTRLCNFGVSVARLAPGSSYSHGKVDDIWDNSAVATLVRAAFECFLLFFYIGVDDVQEDEWAARQNLMYLHDATMRLRIFHHTEDEAEARAFYSDQRDVLLRKLEASGYFQSLSERRQARLRGGRDMFFLSQDEILARIGSDEQQIRRFYEFLSAHAHSLPVAFYRAMEDGRGRGIENDPEKSYLAQALRFLAAILTTATGLYVDASAPYLAGEASPTHEGH